MVVGEEVNDVVVEEDKVGVVEEESSQGHIYKHVDLYIEPQNYMFPGSVMPRWASVGSVMPLRAR